MSILSFLFADQRTASLHRHLTSRTPSLNNSCASSRPSSHNTSLASSTAALDRASGEADPLEIMDSSSNAPFSDDYDSDACDPRASDPSPVAAIVEDTISECDETRYTDEASGRKERPRLPENRDVHVDRQESTDSPVGPQAKSEAQPDLGSEIGIQLDTDEHYGLQPKTKSDDGQDQGQLANTESQEDDLTESDQHTESTPLAELAMHVEGDLQIDDNQKPDDSLQVKNDLQAELDSDDESNHHTDSNSSDLGDTLEFEPDLDAEAGAQYMPKTITPNVGENSSDDEASDDDFDTDKLHVDHESIERKSDGSLPSLDLSVDMSMSITEEIMSAFDRECESITPEVMGLVGDGNSLRKSPQSLTKTNEELSPSVATLKLAEFLFDSVFNLTALEVRTDALN